MGYWQGGWIFALSFVVLFLVLLPPTQPFRPQTGPRRHERNNGLPSSKVGFGGHLSGADANGEMGTTVNEQTRGSYSFPKTILALMPALYAWQLYGLAVAALVFFLLLAVLTVVGGRQFNGSGARVGCLE